MSNGKFSAGEARATGLVDVADANRQYNALVGRLHGGLDRTNAESNWINRSHLVDYALQKVQVTNGIELASALQDNGGTAEFNGLCYDDYGGEWYPNSSLSLTGLKEGMLHIEFSSCYWIRSVDIAAPKAVRWRLLWDGQVVASTGEHFLDYGNIYLCADIPVAGDGTLSLEFSFTSMDTTYDVTSIPHFYFWGGSLLTRGVWR